MEKLKYAFAYWHLQDKKWHICNTYFVLSDGFGENNIYGQFLSSNWFSYHHFLKNKFEPFHFAVLGLKNKMKLGKAQNVLNSHRNVVPSINDIHCDHFDFTEYFYLDIETIKDICSTLKENSITTTFTMRGKKKSKHRLSLNIRKFADQGEEKMSIALPQISL